MNRIQTIALSLAALFAAAATPACVADPDSPDDADDEEVASAEQAAGAPDYSLGSTVYLRSWNLGVDVELSEIQGCDMFANGVVRSWQLKEKNARDFRFSKHFCRDMQQNGTLGADNDFTLHFFHDGDGALGMSSIPLDKVPVGVRFQAATVLNISGDSTHKISDVAMLYESAYDVYNHLTGYSQASYALGRSDDTYTLTCLPGQVMTGIGVHEKPGSGDKSEITGLSLGCRILLYQ